MYKMEKLKQDVRNYQLQGGNTYMQYEQDRYSVYQNYLYKRAQVVLNVAKQRATIEYTNFIFKTLFPKSAITDALLSMTETDDKFKNTLTFKDLNIGKDKIITIFIEEGILPKNFLSLQEAPVSLPRLKNEVKA